MSNLFKAVGAFSVAVLVIFILTMQKQDRHEMKTDQMQATFERDWNEWNAEFTHNTHDRETFEQRAADADKRLKEIGPKYAAAEEMRAQTLREALGAAQDYRTAEMPKPVDTMVSAIEKLVAVIMLIIGGIFVYRWYRDRKNHQASESE